MNRYNYKLVKIKSGPTINLVQKVNLGCPQSEPPIYGTIGKFVNFVVTL